MELAQARRQSWFQICSGEVKIISLYFNIWSKLQNTTSHQEKKLFTLLPKSWTFDHHHDDEIICVQNLYLSDDHSRELPGMRTKKNTKERYADGNYIVKQKRLLLININELNAEFKTVVSKMEKNWVRQKQICAA